MESRALTVPEANGRVGGTEKNTKARGKSAGKRKLTRVVALHHDERNIFETADFVTISFNLIFE